MKRGYDDGLISGLDDFSVAPDAPITAAQMITVLCRVLGATEKADTFSLGIAPDVWYADAAAKALWLGFISDKSGSLDAVMTRQDALAMLSKAFCLVPAEPDYSVLDAFSDSSKIAAGNRGALAALVSAKLIQGFDGALNVNSGITRAEFLTVLYRVASCYTTADALVSDSTDGFVLKGGGSLNRIDAGNIWFDCSAQSVSLNSVKANTLTLRSNELTNLSMNGSDISNLVVAVGKGNISLGGDTDSKIVRLRLESCTGASVGPGVNTLELTGNGLDVEVSGAHDYLVVTGNGCTVTLLSGASVSKIKINGINNIIKTADGAADVSCGDIEVSGNGSTVSLVCSTDTSAKLSVGGDLNQVGIKSGKGLGSVDVGGNSNWLSLSCGDIASVAVSGTYNTVNKLDAGAVASVELPGVSNAFVLAEESTMASSEIKGSDNIVTVNGSAGAITLTGRKTTLNGTGRASAITINAIECKISLAADKLEDNSNQAEIDRVLKLVTLGYAGNYTLKWAQEHDYTEAEKETWINAKDYSSTSAYLIWINLSMQRVNVFKGTRGSWELVYSCIVGTGAPGRGTPVGVYKTTYKTWAGWTTPTYTVKPVVGFKDNTGYAFHSRLFRPGTSTLSDASIGFPVSHGCVRMYDKDILYIYNDIPLGTTVVVY